MNLARKLGTTLGALALAATGLSGLSTSASADTMTNLSVVNAYTPRALAAAGSLHNLEDLSAQSINAVNVAMQTDGIPIHVSLAGMTETTGVDESAGESPVLNALEDSSSNFAAAKALRASTKAHVLMMFTSGTNDGGLSFVNSMSIKQFSLGTVDVAGAKHTRGMSYAHEFGHVLGAQHDIATNPGATSTALGFADPDHGVRDLMSYPTACTAAHANCQLVDAYSDPSLMVNGHPFGNAHADVADWMKTHTGAYAKLGSINAGIVTVTSSTPSINEDHVDASAPMTMQLSGSVTNLSAHLETSGGGIVPVGVNWNPSSRLVTFTPHAALPTGAYRLVVKGANLPEQTTPFTIGYGASMLRASGNSDGTISVLVSKSDTHITDSLQVISASGKSVAYSIYGIGTPGGIVTYHVTPTDKLAHGTYRVVMTHYMGDGLSVPGADKSVSVTL